MDSLQPEARAQIVRLVKSWVWIMCLGAIEFSLALLPVPHTFRPLIMLPGLAMIAGVAMFFMEVNRGPTIVRAFAVAALFWLFVLLVLGSCDPFTRTDYKVAPAPASGSAAQSFGGDHRQESARAIIEQPQARSLQVLGSAKPFR
jgi:hypothetical protein